MTRPAVTADASTGVESAARRLAGTDMHHLVVVDGSGVAVGMLSTLDLLRAVLDMPARHPTAFPHWDVATRVSWTDDWTLEPENLDRAPGGGGVLQLVRASAGEPDEVVWVEACASVRARLVEMTSSSVSHAPALVRVLALRGLRFRSASVNDEAARARLIALLRDRLDHTPPPGSA
jgi:CBS domain-containing protein